MTDGKFSGVDLVGLKPVAEAILEVTKAAVEEAKAVFDRICLPGAEQLGLLVQDQVSYYRAYNLINPSKKMEKKMTDGKVANGARAHPLIAHFIIDKAAWQDDSRVQDMWAGLLASSCTAKGDDDSNLIFADLLGRLTKLQARVLDFSCKEAKKTLTASGLIFPENLTISVDRLCEIAGEKDIHRLDRELDHMRSLALLMEGTLEGTGLSPNDRTVAIVTPSAFALHMYVRCQGSRVSPIEYFGLAPVQPPAIAPTTA